MHTVITVSQFRAHVLRYLKRAHAGEQIVITSQGEPLASIGPPIGQRERARAELAEIAKTIVIGDVLSPIDEEWDAQA